MLNYEIDVVKNTITKINDTCLIISTFKSKEITAQTIESVISRNSGIDFDIVVVDNGGHDHKYILDRARSRGFENLHCLVLKENVGGAGAFFIGQKICYESGYYHFILSDNDAQLITPDGIEILVRSLEKYDLVIPDNIDDTTSCKAGTDLEFTGTVHYLTLSRNTIERLGFINKNYFIIMDDLDYIARANSLSLTAQISNNCQYVHPYRKISLFYNFTEYFTIRNHLLFIFKNPNYVANKYKLLSSRYLLMYLIMKIIHFLQLRDTSIMKTMFLAFRDFFLNNIELEIPNNRFEFINVEQPDVYEARQFRDINLDKNRLFMRNHYFIRSKYDGTVKYFMLRKGGWFKQ